MKKTMLLPHGFQKIGWAILISTAFFGILIALDGYNGIPSFLLPSDLNPQLAKTLHSQSMTHLTNNIALIGIILGCLFITCSREKVEDELIDKIRLNSLLLALVTNYTIVIIISLFVYDFAYLDVMLYNLFTILLLFLGIFRYKLWRLRKEVRNEE